MGKAVYRGAKTREISFPLGGIGTGCIGLSGSGRLVDWEIFNRPSKGSINGCSHFAVKAESGDRVVDARVLHADLAPPYTGERVAAKYEGFGFGPARGSMAGLPHFRDASFSGEFPRAAIQFEDATFPGMVTLRAFNPFIPGSENDSSIPAAFFQVEVENTTPGALTYLIALSLCNPLALGTTVNRATRDPGLTCLHLVSRSPSTGNPGEGDICAATDAPGADCQEYWYRGRWFDSLGIYWKDFTTPGPLRQRTYPEAAAHVGFGASQDCGTVAVRIPAQPGARASARFVIAWSFPWRVNDWNPEQCGCADGRCATGQQRAWKNHYATIFADSVASARYALRDWDRLTAETGEFCEALHASTIPAPALDAVSANLAVLKSPTCLRLEDGSFYGFEGCHSAEGCCEGSCTHVWNYAYALPFLFPALERSMREMDFKWNQRDDGGMAFRLQLPVGRQRSTFRPCADGEFGGVVKAYRDWKICGDTEWLKRLWPSLKRSVEFAWSPTNADGWDADKDGVLEGRQHHTLDMELFGPSSWLTGFYLAALKAGAEMADAVGDRPAAVELRGLFQRGKEWADRNLFNGRWYHQRIDLHDRSILERYNQGVALTGDDVMAAYWNDEAGEMKYQVGEGCEIDQVVAQWHANLCGLGEIFDPAQVRTALQSIYRCNFKRGMRTFANPCRLYCLNDESGLVVCEWPEGVPRPVVPLPYAEETQNGYEYAAAVQMIQSGLVDEGLECIAAVRARYDGEKRNPWNEFECGSNYARSMASYSILAALSGFEYDLTRSLIGFSPKIAREHFSCPWSLGSGWGVFSSGEGHLRLRVARGSLALRTFRSDYLVGSAVRGAELGGHPVRHETRGSEVTFTPALQVTPGAELVIAL